MSGINVVGVQFRRAGKIYDFNASDHQVKLGDRVVVETERGLSLAEVKKVAFEKEDAREPGTLKPVVRIATNKDLDTSGRLDSSHAESYSKDKIKDLGLEMHVIGVETQFGGNKVIIYFSAPGRVDFRELVKELASGLKTRVELKQVGARDEAKLSGGLGICGREFCCSSFLREFVPVSIKMAKNQNLALNPSKVSGGCGRLLCCLTYEDETYTTLRQKLLPKGARVKTPEDGFGDVIKGDILNQVSLVELDSGDQKSFPLADLKVVEKGQGIEDDWGDDINLGELMSDGDTSSEPKEKKQAASEDRSNRGKREGGSSRSQGQGKGRPRRGRDNRGKGDRNRSEGKPSGRDGQESRGKEGRGNQEDHGNQGNRKRSDRGGGKGKSSSQDSRRSRPKKPKNKGDE